MRCPSLASVGTIFNKDHASVLHGMRKITNINSVSKPDRIAFEEIVFGLKNFILKNIENDKSYNEQIEKNRYLPNCARKFFIIFE
jgi:hypothetical protein